MSAASSLLPTLFPLTMDLHKKRCPYVEVFPCNKNTILAKMSYKTSQQRRGKNSSEYSVGLDVAADRARRLEEELEKSLADEDSTAQLQKMLSFRSQISTTSSFAEGHQAAKPENAGFNELGNGSVGTVYDHPGTPWCYKLSHLTKSDKLFNNYRKQDAIRHAFTAFQQRFPEFDQEQVQVPKGNWFIPVEKDKQDWWKDNGDRFIFEFPEQKRKTDVFCMERIFPVPAPMRNALIDRFCNPKHRDAARANSKNKACLVRVMLGRSGNDSSALGFNLRNFSMTADKFEKLGMDALDYAEAMGHAMAVMHWQAKLDGEDIEFVIGSTPTELQDTRHEIPEGEVAKLTERTNTHQMVVGANFKKRVMCMWMLDFGSCNPITVDVDGVNKAIEGFFNTLAFCPRPHPNNTHRQKLWTKFRTNYLMCSLAILGGEFRHLPEMFLDGVLERVKANRANDPPETPPGSSTKPSSSAGSGRPGGSGRLDPGVSAPSWRGGDGNDGGPAPALVFRGGRVFESGGAGTSSSSRGGSSTRSGRRGSSKDENWRK